MRSVMANKAVVVKSGSNTYSVTCKCSRSPIVEGKPKSIANAYKRGHTCPEKK